MNELNEPRWAVLSARGCEALGLSYVEAAELMRRLVREKISGVAIITDEAAHRVSLTENSPTRQARRNGTRPRR